MAGRREQILGAALVVVAAVGAYVWTRPTAGSGTAPGSRRSMVRAATSPGVASPAPDVRLDSLKTERPGPGTIERNLFRFKPRPAPPEPRPVIFTPPPPPPGPPPPPPVPPIGLKFIGLLEPSPSTRIAILSDGRGTPIYGKEGEAVLGQYRILHIGSESIEMAYLDGHGRQTIRLSGS